jgi:CxxC motif-containing protein (DUF1111 family)
MRSTRRSASSGARLGGLGLCVVISQALGGGPARADSKPAKADPVAQGYEIFNREWMPNDPRGHGGDGLGPVYNDTSCVACHNSGGSGGAGPVSKNIDILNASRNQVPDAFNQARSRGVAVPASSEAEHALDAVTDLHAGFRTSRTVVLHKFGTDPNYDSWRRRALQPSGPGNLDVVIGQVDPFSPSGELPGAQIDARLSMLRERLQATRPVAGAGGINQAANSPAVARALEVRAAFVASGSVAGRQRMQVGEFSVSRSQRNPTPLFGLGLIDAISPEAIEAMANRQAKEAPEIHGRVSRLKDGRIGRLGWKGQTASAEDFVLNACAVELGLEVPGHHQAMLPQAPKYQAGGLDLTSEECAALTAYVRSLPRPVERAASSTGEAKFLAAGRTAFTSVGCVGCHAPKLGKVEGLFSDLLLHDMGADMGDDGSYSDGPEEGSDEPLVPRFSPEVADSQQPVQTRPPAANPLRGASRQEWRTPPLWGFRDSGPYLHDGRAQTLEQAVAMHGGQGEASARKFFELSPRERLQVEAFLKSLIAPPSLQLAHRGD